MSTRSVKIVLLTLPLIGAAYYFGVICGQMSGAYDLLLAPSRDGMILLLRMLLALGIVAVAAGTAAVLVRPTWATMLAFSLSGAALLLGWEVTQHSMVLTVLYVVAGIAYVVSAAKELGQRIKFSLSAVSEGQSLYLVALLVVVLGSFYTGCAERIKREGFSIPEEYVATFVDQAVKRVAPTAPEAARDAVQSEVRQQFRRMLDVMLQQLEPFEQFIPLFVTLGLFMSLFTSIRLLSWVPMLIMGAVFELLKAVGIARVTVESVEVERLVLS